MKRLERILCRLLRRHLAEGGPVLAPAAGVILWQAFADLTAARRIGSAGPQPLALAEVEAWARLHRYPLAPRHVAVIRAMDRAYLEHAYGGGEPPALTGAAFDAMFSVTP